MELLIRNAHIVDSSQDFLGDVYIKDGLIEETGTSLDIDCEAIDASGHLLMPSFVDLHCHFRDPGLTYKEDIYTGSLAAVKGGFTAVNLMANTKPICSSMETVEYVLKKAGDIGLIEIHQCVSITKDMDGEDISHLDGLDSRVKFISDDGKDVLRDDMMLRAMEKAASKGMTIMSHAENELLTPIDTRLSENVATARNIYLSAYTGCPLHICHVSTKEAMEEIIRAKDKGCKITCETGPHYLSLTDETAYRVNPSLRKKEDRDFLIKALKDGYIDAIATDHAPHSFEDKQKGAPGLSGLETSFPVCYTELVKKNHITLNRLSEAMSETPARIMGLNKGQIRKGFDGDLCLIDVDTKYAISPEEFLSKGKNTPFDGREVYGKILKTIRKGTIVYDEGGTVHDN